jgi:hypothetical protein
VTNNERMPHVMNWGRCFRFTRLLSLSAAWCQCSYNCRVRKVNLALTISNFAGDATGITCSFGGDGGLATAAYLAAPTSLLLSSTALLIADAGGFNIRSVSLSSGIISTLAGSSSTVFTEPGFRGDFGVATSALLGSYLASYLPGNLGLAWDELPGSSGFYIADA